jgi:hypothetical protein
VSRHPVPCGWLLLQARPATWDGDVPLPQSDEAALGQCTQPSLNKSTVPSLTTSQSLRRGSGGASPPAAGASQSRFALLV